ncbi:hypothetical protein Agub_g8724 [Astrephomene gubernaculifera]|uniref:Guanylate cyclase domain-containing protein n=1 Tax=Astrephomene gubernaculifera TaxID=47775 RepID=A0AAD3DS42_9CHLO|nr:hypothetical protein Agub_g8724 [Astrephomene gubernaculifera]
MCLWAILLAITTACIRVWAQPLNDDLASFCGPNHGQRVLQSCRTEDSGVWAESPRLAIATMLHECLTEANNATNTTIRPLRILAPDGTLVRTLSQLASSSNSSSFSGATGVPVKFVLMSPGTFSATRGSMLLDTSPPTANSGYDAIMVAPTAFGDAAQVPGKLLDLSYIVSDDTMLDWEGIRPQFRGTAVTYDGAVVALPLLPVPFFTYYHLPIFQRDGLRPPRTWEEFTDLAERYHGREGLVGACLWVPNCRSESFVLRYILGSYVQTHGPSQGVLWDAETLQQLGSTEAVEAALRIMRRIRAVGLNSSSIGVPCVPRDFNVGRCLLAVGEPGAFKSANLGNSSMRGRIGLAPLPGSTRVLDRPSGRLVPCDQARCPLAQDYMQEQNGTITPINRAPLVANTVILLNGLSPPLYQFYAFTFFTYVLSPRVLGGAGLLMEDNEAVPVRARDMAPDTAQLWVARGYDAGDVARFLDVYSSVTASSNPYVDLKMRYASNATTALLQAGLAAVNMTLDADVAIRQAVTQLGAALQAIVDAAGLQAFATEYRRSLNWQPSPPPAASPPPPVVAAASRRRRTAASIAVPCAAALLMAAGLAAAVLIVRRRRAAARAADVELQQAPGVGPNTTLVVTDIQDSTTLWEALDVAVMDAALKTHHTVVRELLRAHHGYESATEGDSFILAFHTPHHAVSFCLAAQQALLEAPWPRELLDHAPLPPAAADPWDNPSGVVVMTHLPPTKPTSKSLPTSLATHSQQGQPTPASSATNSPKKQRMRSRTASQDIPLSTSRRRIQMLLPSSPAPRRQISSIQLQGATSRYAATAATSALAAYASEPTVTLPPMMPAAGAAAARSGHGRAGIEGVGNSTEACTSTASGTEEVPQESAPLAAPLAPLFSSAAASAFRAAVEGAASHQRGAYAATIPAVFPRSAFEAVAAAAAAGPAEDGLLPPTQSGPLGMTSAAMKRYASSGDRIQPANGSATAPPLCVGREASMRSQGAGTRPPSAAGDSGRLLEAPRMAPSDGAHGPPAHAVARLGQLPMVSQFGRGTTPIRSQSKDCHTTFCPHQTALGTNCSGKEMTVGMEAAAAAAPLRNTPSHGLSPFAGDDILPAIKTCGPGAPSGMLSRSASGGLDLLRSQTCPPERMPTGPAAFGVLATAAAAAAASNAAAAAGVAAAVPDERYCTVGPQPVCAATTPMMLVAAAVASERMELLREAPSAPIPSPRPNAVPDPSAAQTAYVSTLDWLRQQWVVLPSAVTPTEDHEAAGPVLSPVAGGEGAAAAASAAGGLAAACRMGGSDSPVSGLSGRNVVPDASRSGGRWVRVGGGGAASARVLVYRGLRVRMGCACRLLRRTDVSQNQASGRMQYSGPALRLAKAVADAANGGMVLLSDCTYDSLCNEGAVVSKALPHVKLLWLGRYVVGEDLPPLHLIQALTRGSFMMGRLALQRPLRNVTPVPPLGGSGLSGVLAGPMMGHGAVARISVMGYGALLAWNVEVAHRALNVLYDALLDGLVCAAGATFGDKMPYVVEGAFGLYSSGGSLSCKNSGAPQEDKAFAWTNEMARRKTKVAGVSSTSSGSATLPVIRLTGDAAAIGCTGYGDGGIAVGTAYRRSKHRLSCDDGNTFRSTPTSPQLPLSELLQRSRSGSANVLGQSPPPPAFLSSPPPQHQQQLGLASPVLSAPLPSLQTVFVRRSSPEGLGGPTAPTCEPLAPQRQPRSSLFGGAARLWKQAAAERHRWELGGTVRAKGVGLGGGGGSGANPSVHGAPGAMTVVFSSPQEAAAWLLRALEVLPYLHWPAELLQSPMYEELAVDRAGRIVLRPAALGWHPSARTILTPDLGLTTAAAAAVTRKVSCPAPDVSRPTAGAPASISDDSRTARSSLEIKTRAHIVTTALQQPATGYTAAGAVATAATAATAAGGTSRVGVGVMEADGSSLGGAETGGGNTTDVSCSDTDEGIVLLQRGLRARAALAYGELGGELPGGSSGSAGGSQSCQLTYKGRAWVLSRNLLAKGKPGKVMTNEETASLLPRSLASRVSVAKGV